MQKTLHTEASDILIHSSGEQSRSSLGNALGRETSRNNRRRLWDALMRATSRRRTLHPMLLEAREDNDGAGSLNDSQSIFDWISIAGEESFVDEGGSALRRNSEPDDRRWGLRLQLRI